MSGKLSNRKKQIITYLINEKDYISASDLSKKLNVSRRTILREIQDVVTWLEGQGMTLDRKTGKGLVLLGNDFERQSLLNTINQLAVNILLSPEERQQKILVDLLNAAEPRKLFYFSNLLSVSEATISYDLDKIQDWLKTWHLNLLRKPGFGVVIEGREKDFRKAIIHLFNEYFDKGELLDLLQDQDIAYNDLEKKTSIRKALLECVGHGYLIQIESALSKSGVLETYPLADNAYSAFIIHLSLAIKRLHNKENIHFEKAILEEIKDSNEFAMGLLIKDEIEKSFHITIPEDEVGYMALHLQGSRLRMNHVDPLDLKVHNYEVIYLVEKLIEAMETITGYILLENQQLLTGLINHFGPAISRIKQGMEIKNPLLDEMKNRYGPYFHSVSMGIKVIEEALNIKIPEDEIAYLTMHFAAAVESIKKVAVGSHWRVAIVCSTGIGSSKLLEARLKNHYKNMKITYVLSSSEVKNYNRDSLDLIISTIPLRKTHVPVVVVSPLLLEDDLKKVENALNAIVPLREHNIEMTEEMNFTERLGEIAYITKASLSILNSFFILVSEEDDLESIIDTAVAYMTTEDKRPILKDELLNRETIGTTWFEEKKGRLLHCQSKVIEDIQFGFVLSDHSYAAVMVGHNNLNTVTRKLLGQISLNLMENTSWLEAVKSNNLKQAYYYLENIIKDYYKNLIEGKKI